ncbi:MAG: hypothetical protein HC795_19365 [Coleofasciculaceae cyanobacterium RL_1_1]|nr:hypothetical protein [Coleofasciculaceae cyanobacterium RL_1_1]
MTEGNQTPHLRSRSIIPHPTDDCTRLAPSSQRIQTTLQTENFPPALIAASGSFLLKTVWNRKRSLQ